MLVCHKPLSGNRLCLSLQDLHSSVRRLCRFLGQDLDDDAISSVVQNASFTAMRENPMCSSILLPSDIMDQTKGQFLRKGEQEGPHHNTSGRPPLSGVLPYEDRESEGILDSCIKVHLSLNNGVHRIIG